VRRRIPEIALGALLAVAVFAMGMTFEGARDQAAQSNTAQKREDANQAKMEGSFGGWVTHDAAGFFTFWLVIVGCGQAGLFFWQLLNMRKGMDDAKIAAEATRASAEAAKEQIDLNFRPRIRIKHLWLTSDIWEGAQVEATIVFVNAGTAVATLSEVGFATCIVDRMGMLPTDPNYVKRQTFPIPAEGQALFPGISVEIKKLSDYRVLTDPDNVKLRRGDASLYWLGYVEYRDRRNAVRKTAFCRVLKLPPNATAVDRGRFVRFDDPDYEYED
jgi:hypothetical protein